MANHDDAVTHYHIADDADLAISVFADEPKPKLNTTSHAEPGSEPDVSEPSCVGVLHVRKSILEEIRYFQVLLRGPFREGGKTAFKLHGDDARALNVWFRILHDSELVATFAQTSINVIWEMLAVAHKYDIPLDDEVRAWFARWFKYHDPNFPVDPCKRDEPLTAEEKTNEALRMLLLPCHTLDYAAGFMKVSRELAYTHAGHITEWKPPNFKRKDLHLPQLIIQQLNAAKGRLRIFLHGQLYDPIQKLLQIECTHKEAMLYAYEKNLNNSDAWPLEKTGHRHDIRDLLGMLEHMDIRDVPEGCDACRINIHGTVAKAIEKTERYFTGLCLDCMEKSKNEHDDYWNHDRMQSWGGGCRVAHREPTWYFSFMGRRQLMTEWTKKKRGGYTAAR